MIPLIDDYLKTKIQKQLKFMKDHPEVVEVLFGKLATRENVKRFKQYLVDSKIKVIIGFPREPQTLPCYVITLAGEQEQSYGIGEEMDVYEDAIVQQDEDSETNAEVNYLPLSAVGMKATYRVECWSDNGDLTAFMYNLLKFCLLTVKTTMYQDNFLEVSWSASDLEPVPDYFPVFVYRRAGMITLTYPNVYFDTVDLENIDISDGQDIIKYIPHYYIADDENKS